MITYDLQCSQGHTFEGWFEDRQAYEHQQHNGQIACPVCDDTEVERRLSTFAIKHATAIPARGQVNPAQLVQAMASFIRNNFDDVGVNFAREALKMHYGVCEPRNIRGVSTDAEEKTLREEGIDFLKVPLPPLPDSETSSE